MRVRLMVLPVMSPLSLLHSVMALAIVLVDRLMSVSVRRWRENTFVVRWCAPTFVRPVTPAAAASLASLSTSAPAFFLARRLSRSRPRPRRPDVSEGTWDLSLGSEDRNALGFDLPERIFETRPDEG